MVCVVGGGIVFLKKVKSTYIFNYFYLLLIGYLDFMNPTIKLIKNETDLEIRVNKAHAKR